MRLDLYIRIPKYQSRFHLNSKRIGIDLHSISYIGLFKMFSGIFNVQIKSEKGYKFM